MTEMIIGLDPHKSSNTIAVVNRDEELKTRRRFDNTDDGLVDMLAAVADFDDRSTERTGSAAPSPSDSSLLARTSSTFQPSWPRCGSISKRSGRASTLVAVFDDEDRRVPVHLGRDSAA